MNTAHDDTEFDGLALHDFLPLSWEPSPLSDPAELDHYNMETARALQALALFEEAPKDLSSDTNPNNQDLLHLEAKVDVLLSLVTRLVSHQDGMPKRHNTVLRADTLEWAGPSVDHAKTGDSGVIVLYPNPLLPMPFRLAGRIVGTIERSDTKWRLTRFDHLSPLVSVGLEKLVFRRHRRQVAISRGTDVFSKTGIHRAPKF
ncbi:MAG: PilZ domain-containing protein [Gammaproteobacteria bacterium]